MLGRTGIFARSYARTFSATAPAAQIYDNVLSTIGRTPVVKINKIGPEDRNIYAKLEYFNPLSSVKDRLAIGIIEHAEKTGALKPGMTVVEATSGNTGIAMAMVCAQKGYPCVICMAETFSVERRKIMRSLGAKVILTPAAGKGSGMVAKARELAKEHGWFWARQFENEANAAYHAQTTGPEILSDFAGRPLDYWVSGYGTGGTISGAGRVIKVGRPDVKIVMSEPETAALMSSGKPQKREADGSTGGTHEAFTPHPIQGWTPDFIPLILEKGAGVIDETVLVTGPESIAMAQQLAKKEGIFCGISGGGSMAAAVKLAEKVPAGSTILTMIPDTAERYLSTPLFESIGADMNDEEQKIAESTSSFILERKA